MAQLLAELGFWHWFALALLLLVTEVSLAIGVLLWIGLAAGIIGIITWLVPALAWSTQLLLFAIVAIVNTVTWWRLLRADVITSDKPQLNRRAEQLIGRECILQEPIIGGQGRVEIGGSYWRVTGIDCAGGARVKVVAVDGVVLQVQQVES